MCTHKFDTHTEEIRHHLQQQIPVRRHQPPPVYTTSALPSLPVDCRLPSASLATASPSLSHHNHLPICLQPDPFLNELTNMFERTREKGSEWVTLKHCSSI
ncbi:signal recognition particle 14 kDa protein [Striga asiatica]|uniref:Signal recognition particle 14 kDa protein n=1 Tax=Striga asiatica TaxID=4170 RepID=A0A5A7P8V7_STRAF|nr:signal recognition particle 14 kDa protein [Striga asiatica]